MKSTFSVLPLSALLIFFLAGCSGGSDADDRTDLPEHIRELENLTVFPADVEPTHTIDLVPVQTFGDREEPLITAISEVVVDDQDRVLLSDRSGQSFKLHAFNPDGSYHSQIGRSGQGPGEYQYISNLQIKSDNLYLQDAQTSRINIYSADDFFFKESFVPQQWDVMQNEAISELRFSEFYVRSDGNYLIGFRGNPTPDNEPIIRKLLIVSPGGSLAVDNVLEFSESGNFMQRRGEMVIVFYLPFTGRTFQAFSGDDEIYLTSSEDFLIKKYDAEGRYQFAFYYPVQNAPFKADAYFEDNFNMPDMNVRSAIENAIGLPETWPALDQLRMDDENRIWAAVIVEDQEMYEWWVLEESGELVAKFDWPRNRQMMAIENGHLYTREIDEETSLQTVEKYRIQLTEL